MFSLDVGMFIVETLEKSEKECLFHMKLIFALAGAINNDFYRQKA